MHLTVITATWQRPAQLTHCLLQFQQQARGRLECEHLVVSDGRDARAGKIARQFGARYVECREHRGLFGAYAKDLGIQHARGEYVCFWDDDNAVEPQALAVLHAAAYGVDIGVVQIRHLDRPSGQLTAIPRAWTGSFLLGDVDTLCVCVRRERALTARWADAPEPKQTDFHWLTRLATGGAQIRFYPAVIGIHL